MKDWSFSIIPHDLFSIGGEDSTSLSAELTEGDVAWLIDMCSGEIVPWQGYPTGNSNNNNNTSSIPNNQLVTDYSKSSVISTNTKANKRY